MLVPITSSSIKWISRVHFSMATSMKKYMLSNLLVLKMTRSQSCVQIEESIVWLETSTRAWYKMLRDFLLSKGFIMGKVDITLFTKKIGKDLFVLQIYVDDIYNTPKFLFWVVIRKH
jgi:hypothetical protein